MWPEKSQETNMSSLCVLCTLVTSFGKGGQERYQSLIVHYVVGGIIQSTNRQDYRCAYLFP